MINFERKMLTSGKNLTTVRTRISINGLNIFFFILATPCCWALTNYNSFNDDSMFRPRSLLVQIRLKVYKRLKRQVNRLKEKHFLKSKLTPFFKFLT